MAGSPLEGSPRGGVPGVEAPSLVEPEELWRGPWLGPVDPESGCPRLAPLWGGEERPAGWPLPGADGVDPLRGRLRLSSEDVRLPGVLPLTLARHHRGRTRAGRAFGVAWASTLDQRLLLRDGSVRLVTETGRLLNYPRPEAGSGQPVLPERGGRWPLTWDGTPGGTITVHRPEARLTLRFRSLPGSGGAELPLVAVVDGWGNALAIRHDADGRPREIAHSGGHRLGIATDGAGRVVEVRLLSAANRPALLRCRYDQAGNLAEVEDAAGAVEAYVYDRDRRIVERRDRAGDTFRYGHDARGRITAVSGPEGLRSRTLEYRGPVTTVADALGNRWVHERDGAGQLVALTDPLGNVTRYTGDTEGRVLTVEDPLGRTTTHRYDALGHLVETVRPDGTRRTTEHDALGRPTRRTAEDGAVTDLAWDERGGLASVTAPGGRSLRLTYHPGGGPATVTDALGAVWRYTCDRTGLPVAVTDPAGETTGLERDERGAVVRITGPQGDQRRLERDALGRVVALTDALGGTRRWRRDPVGRLLAHTDPAGAETTLERGPLGVCRSLTRPDGSVLRYRYDAELRLSGITDAAGREWEYRHDAAGRLVELADVGERQVRLRRDAAGRCVGWTNGAGQRVSLRLDAAGRLAERRTDLGRDVFRYDPAGRLVAAENSEVRLTVERDAFGAVSAETVTDLTGAVGDRTVAYERDAAGRVTRLLRPSGAATEQPRDAVGRLVGLTADGHQVTLDLDAEGREVERRFGRSGGVRQRWDAGGRLVEQTLLSGGSRRRRAWEYRADGALLGSTDEVAGSVTFERDAAGRPTLVREATGEARFAYDALGQLAGEGREFDGPLLVADASGAGWRHDARGRVVAVTRKLPSGAVGTCHYTWDALDRLTDVVMPDGRHWHYVHDPLGRRVARQLLDEFGEVRERSVVDWAGGLPVARTEPDGSVTSWHWAPGDHRRPLAQTESGGRFLAVVTDPDGTPTELVDEFGDVAWRRRATPWGAPTGQGSDTAHCPLGFPGQLYDEETGLFHDYRHGHRAYDPADARCLSPVADPAGPFTLLPWRG
ncbi:hypothetical protein FH609_001805 [Streptomyces sp. 3MP-14]|uniref:RHS repeat protein n=1 Tax=Streptomyces mimosae TaxID=2586635 RepID=A0A5N6ARU6_9ACTN|nr:MULTISPECIES: DUF6531 domain-containing protein [Streptomyces]KAB8170895.1 hypothetical protein FH607_000665 [Streptomyces mimosae]KAB8179754.1 hypothetical protein FH609_001805 [Streptomyces sp. 3MP-14]